MLAADSGKLAACGNARHRNEGTGFSHGNNDFGSTSRGPL
jgi:hypothetical protein